jgi:hypothetical protein
MGDNDWIIVPNWERFQHYRLARTPAWIKLYTSLNSHDAWGDLTMSERGLLVTIWIEYARSKQRLKVSRMASEARQKSFRRALLSLNHAGFIHFSSRPEVEVEEEEELLEVKQDNPAYPKVSQSPGPRANAGAYHAPTLTDVLHDIVTLDQIRTYKDSLNTKQEGT